MMHPAVLILLWVCLVITIQALQATKLVLAGLPLLAVAYALSATCLIILLRCTRWIMLSLLLIYAYATPCVAEWASLAQFSPTHKGLTNGLLQLCRLAFTLASLAILLNLLPRQQLISGLYVLTYPLRYFGLSRERLAVRLALTLQYADPLYGLPQVIGAPTSYRCWSQQRLNRTASNCTPPHLQCLMA